jgi:hypothetical protein
MIFLETLKAVCWSRNQSLYGTQNCVTVSINACYWVLNKLNPIHSRLLILILVILIIGNFIKMGNYGVFQLKRHAC